MSNRNGNQFLKAFPASTFDEMQASLFIVTYTHELQVYTTGNNYELKLLRKIKFTHRINDIAVLPGVCFGGLLVLNLENDTLQLLGIGIYRQLTVEKYPMIFNGRRYNMIPGSLLAKPNDNQFTVYTREKDLLTFRYQDIRDFDEFLRLRKEGQVNFLKEPQKCSASKYIYTDGHQILKWNLDDRPTGVFPYTMISRDNSGEYYCQKPYFHLGSGKKDDYDDERMLAIEDSWHSATKLPEPVVPVVYDRYSMGSLFFGEKAIYLRTVADDQFYTLAVDMYEGEFPRGSNVSFINNGSKGSLVKLQMKNKRWDDVVNVVECDISLDNDLYDEDSRWEPFLVAKKNGELYLMDIQLYQYPEENDSFDEDEEGVESLRINMWRVVKVKGSQLTGIVSLTRMDPGFDAYCFFAKLEGSKSVVFEINPSSLEVEIIQEFSQPTFVLDGQVFDRSLPDLRFSLTSEDSNEIAVLDDRISSIHFHNSGELAYKGLTNKDKFLDVKRVDNELWVLTTSGIHKDGHFTHFKMSQGVIMKDGEIATVFDDDNVVSVYNGRYDTGLSSISIFEAVKKEEGLYILAGSWDGEISLTLPNKQRALFKLSSSFITSVRLVFSDDRTYIVAGTLEGAVGIFDENGEADHVFIGEDAVHLTNCFNGKMYAFNHRNFIEIKFTETGIQKAYLEFDDKTKMSANGAVFDGTELTFVRDLLPDKAFFKLSEIEVEKIAFG